MGIKLRILQQKFEFQNNKCKYKLERNSPCGCMDFPPNMSDTELGNPGGRYKNVN
jgi:hypothetical protein